MAPTSNRPISIFDTFATVAPDVEPTHGTSVRDKCATLAPSVGPTSNISILDNFARLHRLLFCLLSRYLLLFVGVFYLLVLRVKPKDFQFYFCLSWLMLRP